MFTRRGIIRLGAASVGSLALRPMGLLPALAQNGPDYRALVCIFLFGGNDSNNTVIPMDGPSYNLYTQNRGTLAITAAELKATTVNSANGAPYAFHPSLTELSSLFGSSELAVVANVGSLVQPLTRAQYLAAQMPRPSNLFSHSDQQQQWQTAIAQGNSPTGWAGRVADYVAAQSLNSSVFPTFFSVAGNASMGSGVNTTPVALSPGGSLQITGSNGTTAEAIARTNAMQTLLTTDTGLSLVQAASHVLSNSISDANALTAALAKSTTLQTAFPTTGIGAQLKQVAQIMQVHSYLGMRRQIFFCSLGGFDTHTDQLNQHKTLYPQLSPAMAAFYKATQELGIAQDVTTFTESDFGRTFQSTSGNGSDHAWGSHHMVVGGAVKGGRVFGRFPNFTLGGPDDTDTRGRWIPTTSIDQYGATLAGWFGVPLRDLFSIFPNLGNFDSGNLGFLG